jgi:hypothetical protein
VRRTRAVPAAALTALCAAACGGATASTLTARSSATVVHWSALLHVTRPLDVVVRPANGSAIVAAAGKLFMLGSSGALTRFAPAYASPGGEEPYIAASPGGCFGTGAIYAIRLHDERGITRISASGHVRRFASITASGLIDGIAFDGTGTFGRRLVATINHGQTTTVDTIGCTGAVLTITDTAPRVEGGIAVAPGGFGRFGGDLIAPDETGGRIFAVTPEGRSLLVANSGLPHGGDIGVESEAFVPEGTHATALLADRLTPGNPHPGDDVLLGLTAARLRAVGVHPGDLVVATEGGALVDAVHCTATSCQVRHVADGPAVAHAEGHIAFVAR